MDYLTAKFHLDARNPYLILRFVSAHIPWNALIIFLATMVIEYITRRSGASIRRHP